MKSFAPWIVTVAAAALLALPCAAAAQTPPPTTQPPVTAQPATPPPADAQAKPAAAQGAPQEHLQLAKAALNEVGTANLPARARTQVAELKKRIATLERMAPAGTTGAVTATQGSGKTRVGRTTANWGTEVAAMDKIVTTLLGVSPTGTSGTTSTKAPAAAALDEATNATLTEFRTHLTAFATAMSTTTPAAGDAPAAAPSAATPGTDPAPQQAPATPAQTAPATEPAAPKADQAAAKQHLTEARNTLSQLTQLPAAAQLTGDARTHITQLISNFNELITTQSNWPTAYAKVSANMTALLGPDATAASGTEGAVGTSGSAVTLDPAVREKLVQMRKQLAEFERASGGSTAPAAARESAPAAKPAEPTPPAAQPTTPPAAEPAPSAAPATAPAASDALTHIAAIEALLKTQNEGGGMTLDKVQVELLRTHIAELRKLLEKK